MNIVFRLSEVAKTRPEEIALVFKDKQLTFRNLETLSYQFSNQLTALGFKSGDKTLFFLKPSLDFAPMVFALFRIGVIPVFIDPGMGRKNLLKCIEETNAVGLIAEKEIHFLKLFFPKAFKSVKLSVTTGRLCLGKMTSIKKMKTEKILLANTLDHNPEDAAAILFTSGGTGIPKGVVYTHHVFNSQTTLLQNMFNLTSADIDLPGFPLFSLFTITMGMKSCIPDMDPRHPAKCNPKKLVKNIIDHNPTFVAGSPAIWERVADYCNEHEIILPSIKYVVMFGAPVPVALHQKFSLILPNGTTYTPYGATEALPISNLSGKFILKNTAQKTRDGHGTCIGHPIENVKVKIIKAHDEVIANLAEAHILGANEIGEIIVQGPSVTREYLNLPLETQKAKMVDDENKFWHRMGDVGFLDEFGLLWFCGRKAHCVQTKEGMLYPIQCEAIFNQHPEVKRSALVGLGPDIEKIPAIVIERFDDQFLQGKYRSIFESELLALAKKYPHTKNILKIYFSKAFPVDIRHNIKIDRLKLKREIEEYES